MKNSLTVKDLINIGLFSVLSTVFMFISGMIGFIPVLMPAIPFIVYLFSGPVNMLYATKIKKPFMFFIQQILIALVFLATGHGPWILLTISIGSIIGEIILKKGNYNSLKSAKWAFTISGIGAMGNFIPIYFGREAYIEKLVSMGYGMEYTTQMMNVMPLWSFIPICISGIVGSYIGCSLGILILKKHFIKAGMIKDDRKTNEN